MIVTDSRKAQSKSWFATLRRLVGIDAARWAGLGVVASVGLSGIEYTFALILQVLLFKLGFASATALPQWMHESVKLSLVAICAILIFSGLVRAVFTFLAHQSACVFSHTLSSRLRLLTVYELLLSRDNKFLSAATISNRIGEIFPQAAAFASNLVTLVINGFQIVALVAGLFFFAWKEALIGLIGLGLIGGPVILINRGVRRFAGKLPAEQEGIFRKIERITKNWSFVRISRTQTLEHARLSQAILRYSTHALRSKLYGNLGASLPSFLGIVVLCAIILISQAHFETGVSSLVAFLYLYIRFTHQVSVNAKILTSMGAQYKHFTLAKGILDQNSFEEISRAMAPMRVKGMAFTSEQEFINRSGLDQTSRDVILVPPRVSLRDVCFSWSQEATPLFENFSAEFKGGEFIGIVGPSGVGKSTLLQLILGLIDPLKGEIMLGDLPAAEFLSRFSQSVGYVGAEPFLIDGSVRENLEYGNRISLMEPDVWSALRFAQLHDEIMMLPSKLNHRISETGEGLSMGQKQRLMFARAILRRPRLLILDEVSANLDLATELRLAEGLKNFAGRITVIAVSHRSAILKYADHWIHLLGDGRYRLESRGAIDSSISSGSGA